MSETAPDRHAAAYRGLLSVYPRAFRREVGDAAVAAFADLRRTAAREDGARGVAVLWLRTVPRLLVGGLSERLTELFRGPVAGEGEADDPPYGWATVAAALVFGLYVLTLAPTTAFWDTSEYITTAHIVGIPHSPGNPLFVLLARSWEVLTAPLGLSVAVRVNLFSAFMSATAHGLWFLTVHHVLGSFGKGRAFRLVGAGIAVLVSATAFTVWSQSNVNEKVYTVSLLTIALLSWLAIRWQARAGRPGQDKALVLIAFVLALSVGNHLMAFLAAPALFLFVLLVEPRVLWRWRLYPWLVLAGMVGLSVHLFLPLRAALDPVINEGAPLCASVRSALGSILTYGRAGCEALSASLNRQQYQKPPVWARQAPITEQLTNYLQYFDWQWARGVQGTQTLFASLRLPFTALFTGLGVWGAMEHYKRQRETFWYMATLFLTLSVALTVYMNFLYGFSMAAPEGVFVGREVRERDYFFLVSFSIWALWAGLGIVAAWVEAARALTRGRLLPAAPVLAVAGLPLVLNVGWADRSYDYSARDWAHNLLESIEPYGVLFTGGDNDTFPLWYVQEVEGIRRDVTVIVTQYLNTAWYARQMRDLTRPCERAGQANETPTRIVCQREYRPGPRAEYVYQPPGSDEASVSDDLIRIALAEPVHKPELPVMQLDDDTIERVGRGFVPVDQDLAVDVGGIRTVFREGTFIQPWHQYALAIVDTAFSDDRPVYWAGNNGPAAALGLRPYLVRQGVAFKLRSPTEEPSPDEIVEMPEDPQVALGTGRWLDVTRTEILVNEVFLHRSDLPWWNHWPDAPSAYTPAQYAWAYRSLAIAKGQAGDVEAMDRYRALGTDWMELAQ